MWALGTHKKIQKNIHKNINKNKTFEQGIMAILQSCCFWKSVRKGSYASVIYTLVSA